MAVSDNDGDPTDGFTIQVLETDFLDNLSCDMPLMIAPSDPVVLDTTQEEWISAESPSYISCAGEATANRTRWYRIEGDGLALTATVCTPDNVSVSLRTDGDCPTNRGESPLCKPFSTRRIDHCTTAYSWKTEMDEVSLLSIAAVGPQTTGVIVDVHTNNNCEWSFPIDSLPFTVTANTSKFDAVFDINVFSCPVGPSNFFRGVWYSYTAEGDECLSVSAAGVDVGLDTAIAVYSGSCQGQGGLKCVAANDDVTPLSLKSSVSFLARAGTTYYILVFSTNRKSGVLDISVSVSFSSLDGVADF